jgi:hypothetical protein
MYNSNDDDDEDNRNLVLFDNALNLNLSLPTKNNINDNLNKYDNHFKERKKNGLQKTFCYYNLALLDNIIKNMHKKWSYID